MANLTESSTFVNNIYELATTDPVQGGPGGIANLQAQQLTNRTRYLKDKIDQILAGNFKLKAVNSYASNQTLTVDDAGALVVITGSSIKTMTLADIGDADMLEEQQVILFKNKNTAAYCTIETFSGDGTTFDNGETSINIRENDVLMVIRKGTTYYTMLVQDKTVPVGTVSAFAGAKANVPDGYLVCDGSVYAKADYPDLAALLGTTYGDPNDIGGSSITDFFVPDLRGLFIRGLNTGANSWSNTSSIDSGRTLGSGQSDELKSHLHIMKKYNRNAGSGTGIFAMDDHGTDGSENTELTGGSETRPKNMAMVYIIKY
jgi:microcystin-dependent protein